MGGLVTSTDSGLAVPDWPLSFGGFLPPMVGGIRFEHSHRVIASTVGLLTLILAIWTGMKEEKTKIRWLAIAALGAVVLQGILGGLTVLYRLPAPISVAHACLGPTFFSLVVSLATVSSPKWEVRRISSDQGSFHHFALITTLFIFLQVLLGAIVRHTGSWILVHIAWAFLLLIMIGRLVRKALVDFEDEKEILRSTFLLAFLVIIEFFLGLGAFAFTRLVDSSQARWSQVLIPTLHQTLGSLILAMGVVLALRSRRDLAQV